jgi:hypothetical protein
MLEQERRRREKELSMVLKRQLNQEQLLTLCSLEAFGWELKFIRRPPSGPPIAVVFDADRRKFGVLELDGTLNENPSFDIRS